MIESNCRFVKFVDIHDPAGIHTCRLDAISLMECPDEDEDDGRYMVHIWDDERADCHNISAETYRWLGQQLSEVCGLLVGPGVRHAS